MNLKVYPRLQVISKIESNNIYHIELVASNDDTTQAPVITFVSRTEDEEKLIRDTADYELTGGQLVKQAFGNLRSVQLSWQKVEHNGATYYIIEDENFATEKILDRDFLVSTTQTLQLSSLVVTIPCTGVILCADASDSKSVELLKDESFIRYNDFSKAQLSDLLYHIDHGAIASREVIGHRNISNDQKTDQPEGYTSKITKSSLFESIFLIRIDVSAEDMTTLTTGLFRTLIEALQIHGQDKNFNGTINVQSAVDQPRKNGVHVNQLAKFYERLRSNRTICDQIDKIEPQVSIHFLFGVDFRKGDTQKKYTITI